MRLYNASEDEVAKKTKNAIISADLKSALVPERLALQEFKKHEQEVVKRNQISIRDLNLVAFLSATDYEHSWGDLQTEIAKRYEYLIGGVDPTLNKKKAYEIDNIMQKAEEARRKLDPHIHLYLLATQGKVKLQCHDPLLASQRPKPDEKELAQTYIAFANACTSYIKAKEELNNLLKEGGALLVVSKKIEKIEQDRVSFDENLLIAKNAYDDAMSKSKAANPEDGKIEGFATELKNSFDKLAATPKVDAMTNDKILSRLLDEGKLEQIKKNKVAIDEVIQALQGNLKADAKPALKRLAAISDFEKALTVDSTPPVSALILQSEFLRLEANGIEKHIFRAKERIALLEKKRAAIMDEILFLNEASKSHDTFLTTCTQRPVLYVSFRLATPICRLLLAKALSGYANAMTFGKTEQELIDYQLIEQGHDAALDDSETAFAQTDNLIHIPVDQLAKIYAGGIKSDDLSNLIHALGLTAIAVRVKK